MERIRTQMNLKDSAASKGLVLAMILRDIVVSQQERTKDTEESTIWNFIALRFFGERSAANVAYELEVGERSLPRIQKRALGHFAAALPPYSSRTRPTTSRLSPYPTPSKSPWVAYWAKLSCQSLEVMRLIQLAAPRRFDLPMRGSLTVQEA